MKPLNLGGFAAKPKTKTAAKTYPQCDTPEAKQEADRFLAAKRVMAEAEASLEASKNSLKSLTNERFFEANAGQHEPSSAIEVAGNTGKVLVMHENRYAEMDILSEETLAEIYQLLTATNLPKDAVDRMFQQVPKLEFDGDKAPSHVNMEQLLAELCAVFDKHGCREAAAVKLVFRPRALFHVARHQPLSDAERRDAKLIVARNVALDCFVKPRISVKERK